jgi:hypothetical protein
MKRMTHLGLLSLLLSVAQVGGQTPPGRYAPIMVASAYEVEQPDDPGYALYKDGYGLILNEDWTNARKKFAELLGKYPKSSYVDDAAYWSAYALMHVDRTKAADAYRAFLRTYKESRYYDDAVADLAVLDPMSMATAPRPIPVPRVNDNGRTVTVTIAPQMKKLERVLLRESRLYSRLGLTSTFTPFPMHVSEELNKETVLKMEALYALGESPEDEKSFTTLKDVALNRAQPMPVREAAMEALSHFTKHDVMPVFVEIARHDTSLLLGSYAIDYIGERGTDKDETVALLIDLFNGTPPGRSDQRETIFYTIADIGNEKAVEFLRTVALTSDNYELRRNAVFYLGSIGGEKAREALYEILQAK